MRKSALGWSDRQHQRFVFSHVPLSPPRYPTYFIHLPRVRSPQFKGSAFMACLDKRSTILLPLEISSYAWCGVVMALKSARESAFIPCICLFYGAFYFSPLPSLLLYEPTAWELSAEGKKGTCAERRCPGESRAWRGSPFLRK